jgi:hypothetical protein
MKKISVKGFLLSILVHCLTDIVLGLLFLALILTYSVISVLVLHVPHAQMLAEMKTALHGDNPLHVAVLLVGLVSIAFGGYVAARVAKHDELLNAGLSSFPWIAYKIYIIAARKNSMSLWLQIILLLATPALAIAGGEFMRRQREGRNHPPEPRL